MRVNNWGQLAVWIIAILIIIYLFMLRVML